MNKPNNFNIKLLFFQRKFASAFRSCKFCIFSTKVRAVVGAAFQQIGCFLRARIKVFSVISWSFYLYLKWQGRVYNPSKSATRLHKTSDINGWSIEQYQCFWRKNCNSKATILCIKLHSHQIQSNIYFNLSHVCAQSLGLISSYIKLDSSIISFYHSIPFCNGKFQFLIMLAYTLQLFYALLDLLP